MMGSGSTREIRVRNDPESLRQIQAFLNDLAESAELAAKEVHRLDLAIEEHIANVFRHGSASGCAVVSIGGRVFDDRIEVDLTDRGAEFDPLKHPAVDTSKPLDEKPIGGLGVHMIKQSVDELRYRRVHGANVVTLVMQRRPR